MTAANKDLSWISFDLLCELARQSFKGALEKIENPHETISEPTLLLMHSTASGLTSEESLKALQAQAAIKSLQNAVGTFHQKVLGNVEGWQDMGSNGGIYDIESLKQIPAAGNRKVLAEIKMRYNTIKASDEYQLHQKLADAVAQNGGKKQAVAYLIQMVPKNTQPYDRPWSPSRVKTVDHVRVVDGKTGYHLVTGDPNALDDLFKVLPDVFDLVASEKISNPYHFNWAKDRIVVDRTFSNSYPKESALNAGSKNM